MQIQLYIFLLKNSLTRSKLSNRRVISLFEKLTKSSGSRWVNCLVDPISDSKRLYNRSDRPVRAGF